MSSRKRSEQPSGQAAGSNKRAKFSIKQFLPGQGTAGQITPASSSTESHGTSHIGEQPNEGYDAGWQEEEPIVNNVLPHHVEPYPSGSVEQPASGQPYQGLDGEVLAMKCIKDVATKLVGQAMGACKIGPLQDLSDILRDLADMHITEGKASNEHQVLQQRLQKLLKVVEERPGRATSAETMSKIESIRDFIKSGLSFLIKSQSGKQRGRFILAKEDEDRFLACCHRIQEHMEPLFLDSSILTWEIEEQQSKDRMSSLIGCLPSSPSAWYDSGAGEELERRECTPGTRIQVLANLIGWVSGDNAGGVYWLNGMAGTGKTTIAYSVCKELDAKRSLAANFFCSRQREECRNVRMIIPSIAYQLARFSPSFETTLSAVLEKEPDVYTKRLDMQFMALVREPLLAAQPLLSRGLVVVIDALDECENKDSTRDILNLLLNRAADLPIKFIISSRPEPQIRSEMTNTRARSRLVLHELDKGEVQADIEKYLREGLAPMSPSDEQIAALAERAGVLFIYAATALRYIGYDRFRSDPEDRLRDILNRPQSAEDGTSDEIDELYRTILEAALGNRRLRQAQRDVMRQVLDTVICAREPLTMYSLCGLLGIEDVKRVRTALEPLWSVLHVMEGSELVTTLHASFPDFMFDEKRSTSYYCDFRAHHHMLAGHCLAYIAQTQPQINICGLESSYLPDHQVSDIEERVASSISLELLYACRYWADHINTANCASSIVNELRDFLSKRLLLWMEVLNLTNHMNAATACMKAVASWCQAYKAEEELIELAYDARRFVEAFAASPVSKSTPHIYMSMLTFWPISAPVARHYVRNSQGPIEAEGTALDRRQLALISTWDFTGYILAMAVSEDGLYLALAIDTEVLLVDSTSGRMAIEPLQGHPDSVMSVAFVSDKPWVLGGSFGSREYYATILGWDTGTGNAVLGPIQLRGHTDSICCLRLSPDCSRIATGSEDKTARLWDIESRNMLHQLQANDTVYPIVFSADGSQLIAGANNTLHRWDVRTGQPVDTPITHTEDFDMIAISPDQSRLISCSRNSRTIYAWNALTGDMIRSVEGHTGLIMLIGYSPDGRYIVSGSQDRTVRVWDAQTGTILLGPLQGHTGYINSIVFSPDSSRIISACTDGLVCTWDAQQRDLTSTSTDDPSDRVTCAKFSSDGTHFASGSDEGTVCIRDVQTGLISLGPLELHTDRINALDYENGHVVSGSKDGGICVWDAEGGEVVLGPLQVGSEAVRAIAYSPDGGLIATGSDGGVNVWNAQDGSRVLGPLTDLDGPVWSVEFSPDGTRIVAGSRGFSSNVVVWDVSDGRSVFGTLDGHHDYVNSVSYSPNGALIASGSYDWTIILWDAQTGKKAIGPLTGHSHWVRSVSFSPDSTRLVSGSRDRTIRIWDAQTGEIVFELLHGHEHWIKSVEYSPDGTRIMSRSDDSVRIHDARSPEERAQSQSESDARDWTIRQDGWVVDDQSRLLVWIPGDLRKALMPSITRVMVAPQGYVRLKLDKTLMGESWAEGYTPQM